MVGSSKTNHDEAFVRHESTGLGVGQDYRGGLQYTNAEVTVDDKPSSVLKTKNCLRRVQDFLSWIALGASDSWT